VINRGNFRFPVFRVVRDRELILEKLGICQSTLSCNLSLSVLRTNGVLLDGKEGTSVYYRVSDKNVYALIKTLDAVLKGQCEEVMKALDALSG